MREITIKIYKFNELSETAKENAVYNWQDYMRSENESFDSCSAGWIADKILNDDEWEFTVDGRIYE